MSEGKRIRRTPEQIAADLDVQIEKLKDSILELENKKAASATEFDNKIAAVKEKIAKLEAKKKDVLTPKKRKPLCLRLQQDRHSKNKEAQLRFRGKKVRTHRATKFTVLHQKTGHISLSDQ